jgi:hypothetical protein
LIEPPRSVEAWQKALDALPSKDLTSGEEKQKKQYEASLKSAKDVLSGRKTVHKQQEHIYLRMTDPRLSWRVAESLKDEYAAQKKFNSSVK